MSRRSNSGADAFRTREEITSGFHISSSGHLRPDPIARNPRNSSTITAVSRNRLKPNLTRIWAPTDLFISRRSLTAVLRPCGPYLLPAETYSCADLRPLRSLRFHRQPILFLLSVTLVFLVEWHTATAQSKIGGDAGIEPNQQTTDAAVSQAEQKLEALPEEHRPRIDLKIEPETGLKTGDLVHLRITAEAAKGDDITIPDNAFGAFETHKKEVRMETVASQRRRFVFTIDLIALEPGEQTLPEITLRVVTAEGVVGSVQTKARELKIESLLANEPEAKPKGPTQPVEVLQDDYTLLYILGGILAAVLVALLTLVVARWWRKRKRPAPPPPPPRPPWEIAVEKLQKLQRDKAKLMKEDRGGEFVDRVSDVVREYLGGRFAGGHLAFTGLETTSSELIAILRDLRVEVNLLQEITAFLFRCDLVKFAKVSPNRDEVDLIFAEAQEIVRISTPHEIARDTTSDASESAGEGGRSAR